jgi:dTDP-4-dehydrorhamnose reductase
MSERILVLGGTGLVGNALYRFWRAQKVEIKASIRQPHPAGGFLSLDMTEAAAVRDLLAEFQPSLVAVPAANPFVDDCERRPAETRRVNVDGTLNVARACAERGARMIFFSSDYVFDGLRGSYTEEDPVSPINEYGRQKAETERGVLAAGARNLVIRTSGVYGWQREPKNFVLQVRARLSTGQTMKVAADVSYNPTYAENLAAITAELAAAGASGIFHVVGAQRLARSEFAVRAARAFGLDEKLILPAASAEFAAIAPRPKESSLLVAKVRAAARVAPVGAEEGLRLMAAAEPAWREYAKTLPALPSPS